MPQYRYIESRSTVQEPDKQTPAESRSSTFSWRAGTQVTTVLLSCGHTKDYRGFDRGPKNKALCKECPDYDGV